MVGGAAIVVMAGAKKSFLCKSNHFQNPSKLSKIHNNILMIC